MQFQSYISRVRLSIVPRDDRLRICSAVVTGKYLPRVLLRVLLGEGGTVDPRRVPATLRVDEELGVGDVPRYRAQRLRHELLKRQLGVVDSDLMATKRGAGATCTVIKSYRRSTTLRDRRNARGDRRDRDLPSLQLAHEQFFSPSA